ncbi:hypothetical protein DYB89_14855 [Vibrio cholerae]|nr:hypothetical protein [Vibrio cholerae]
MITSSIVPTKECTNFIFSIRDRNTTFDNGNGKMLTYSEFTLENAVDLKGFFMQIDCPICKKETRERQFDRVEGGSVNQHFSIDCKHCGHHECDLEFCSTCEAESNHYQHLMEMVFDADMLLEECVNNLEMGLKSQLKGGVITQLKILITHARSNVSWYNDNFLKRGGMSHVKRQLLDAKFNRNLALKIALAKTDVLLKKD